MENIAALWRPYKMTDEELESITERVTTVNENGTYRETVDVLVAVIESKSGVLLTHVSMMIAITGIMLSIGRGNVYFEFALAIELVFYLILALLCIRCQYQLDLEDYKSFLPKKETDAGSSKSSQYATALKGELVYRERIFRIVLKTLYFLTAILAATIFFSLFCGNLK